MVSVLVYAWHDDVITWKHLPHYWSFVRGIHRSTVNSPHKGQWGGALIFFICTWINCWVNNREASDLRRHHAHCEVTAMGFIYQSSRRCDIGAGVMHTHSQRHTYGRNKLNWSPPIQANTCQSVCTVCRYGNSWKPSDTYIDSLVQDCSISSALAMEVLQFCVKPLLCICKLTHD